MDGSQVDTLRNYRSFLWHGFFLALTLNFMEVNTVAPDLILRAGGSSLELGILTAIMIGGASVMQLAFAAFLHGKARKKPWLLLGIKLRILALGGMGWLLFRFDQSRPGLVPLILLLIALFSFSGSFANISYMDLLGRSIESTKRKSFFLQRQLLMSSGLLLSGLAVRYILRHWSYPESHGLLFVLAAALLLCASLGFWRVREQAASTKAQGSAETLKQIWGNLKERGNLRYYLILSNLAGISVLIIPFVIARGRASFNLTSEQVGNYLLIQVAGSIAVNLLFRKIKPGSKKYPYRGLLILYILAGALLPPLALLLTYSPELFFLCFVLSGLVVSLHQIVLPAVLIEISGAENRAWLTGITGAFNLAALLFPLAAGAMLDQWGFPVVFLGTSGVILLGLIPAVRMDCS